VDTEVMTPSYAVISRNEAGVFWLRAATRVGRIQLAGLVGEDGKTEQDVLRGAVKLWERISDTKLNAVSS
jgi:hypothetical protein